MKKAILRLAVATVLWCSMLTTAYAPNIFDFSQKTSTSNAFTSSLLENGVVSIAFDDCLQSQYDYAWPLLQARGMTATFYVVSDYIRDLSGNSGYLSVAELQNMYDSGCEIASHSKTHPSFPSLSDSQIIQECNVSKQILQSYGFTVNNFAYPYGGTNDHIDSIVSQYYRSGRNAYKGPYIMQLPMSQFALPGFPGESRDNDNYAYLQSMVDQVASSEGWAIIFFHGIVPDSTPISGFRIHVSDFANFLDYLTTKGVKTITVNQALNIGSRDVAITSMVPSTFQAIAGTIVDINVTVKNEGAITEIFNVSTYYNNTTIETQAVADLAPEATRTLTFSWNTDAVPVGDYTLKAEADTLPDETDTADNVHIDGMVKIVKAPTASFNCYPSDPVTNEPILFDASSSTSNDGTIINYRWNFDDGNITSTSNSTAIHVYTIPRTYNVTLTVTNGEGLTASSWTWITVSALVQAKISVFTHSSTNLVGFKIEINGTLTDSEGNGISGANIIISYTFPDILEWIPFISTTTDFQGNYYSQWIPPSTGDFILEAKWTGNRTYAAANQSVTLDIIPYKNEYVFSVSSNSTVSTLTFNSTSQELEFDATGPLGTTGSTQVTIARALVTDATKLKVYLDGKPMTFSTSSTDDSWIVSFTYAHSTHHIKLNLNPPRLRGDIDNDGKVNMVDLSIVAAAFKSRPTDERWNPAADLNSDGMVNIADIAIVAREYGKQI